ncbi:MAG: hypothetical protein Tsb0016_19610 [Sphingomonadales bacterium]
MRYQFFAILERAKGGGYGVFFPDLPGCIAGGDSIADAVRQAHDALSLHLAGMIEDGGPIPEPSEPEAWADETEGLDVARIALIDVDVRHRPQRINIMLPGDVLAAIDRAADNRSAFLADAAWEKLSRDNQNDAVAGTLARKRRGGSDSKAIKKSGGGRPRGVKARFG